MNSRLQYRLFASLVACLWGQPLLALEERLGGSAYYDPAINVTWLTDANLLGGRSWTSAVEEIGKLNAQGYLGFADWRLPETPLQDPTCPNEGNNGPGCVGSELGHLFYEILGGQPNSSIHTVHGDNFGLFANIQDDFYWSGTENLSFPGPFAFRFNQGVQDASNNYESPYFSWLVRTGDVEPVPIPNPLSLFVCGLGVLLLRVSKRRK